MSKRFTREIIHAGNYSAVVSNSVGSVTSAPAVLAVGFAVNASATYGGRVTKSPDQATYLLNSSVTLTAAPISVYTFTGWSGDASGTNNPLTIVVTNTLNIVANFVSPVADLIVDNPQATFTGTWSTDISAADKYSTNYRTAGSGNSVTATAQFTPTIATGGRYDVYAWFPTITRGASAVPFLISSSDGDATVSVDQTFGSGGWQLLITGKQFAAGTNGFVRISNNAGAGNKNVAADAIRWVYSEDQIATPPTITAQPLPQRVIEGSNATFGVTATGALLHFQWRFNTAPIAGQTNPTLLLLAVSPASAGNYDVTVSNINGWATSTGAWLTVSVRPWLRGLSYSNGVSRMLITGTAGDRYVLETCTNFAAWAPLLTVTNGGGSLLFDAPGSATGQSFYRARLVP
jgi:uncharacterized repeat protein (TIGR02543 family)